MLQDYQALDHDRARKMIERLGVWVLIKGETTKAILHYPTEEQRLMREGVASKGESMRALLRFPELHLHKTSGVFKKGDPVRVLCSPLPDFICDEFYPSSSQLYRLTLVAAQEKPTDSARRQWQ